MIQNLINCPKMHSLLTYSAISKIFQIIGDNCVVRRKLILDNKDGNYSYMCGIIIIFINIFVPASNLQPKEGDDLSLTHSVYLVSIVVLLYHAV